MNLQEKNFLQKSFSSLNKVNERNNILYKTIKNNYKLIPFNFKKSDTGKVKYFPADSKEWKNKIYFFNKNMKKNLPIYLMNIDKLIKSYFNSYFKNSILNKKYTSHKLKRLSLNKIYVSKPQIKHTNIKTVLNIYIYNRENLSLIKRITKFGEEIFNIDKFLLKKRSEKKRKRKVLKKSHILYIYKKRKLSRIRWYKLKFLFNRLKFKDFYLYKLAKLISKFYNRKIEFNIINLKSIVLNTDIFTDFLKYKLKKRRANVIRMMNYILTKVNLFKINSIRERGRLTKSVDFNLLENKYRILNLNAIVNNNNNLDNILKELHNNVIYNEILGNNLFYNSIKEYLKKNIIFNSIKYKNISGIRLEVKGRLTRRYRADRAIFRIRWKGGLKNIDSSFKGLSVINYRGFTNSNVEYSVGISKRRIGAFAVKGWVSGN